MYIDKYIRYYHKFRGLKILFQVFEKVIILCFYYLNMNIMHYLNKKIMGTILVCKLNE